MLGAYKKQIHRLLSFMPPIVLAFSISFIEGISAETLSLGENLERQMWADMKNSNWTAIENNIADNFLSTHWFGVQDREQEIVLIKGLELGAYELKDVRTSESPDIITVAYYLAVEETINKKRTKYKPYPRLSIWKKNNSSWQWIAHANLNPREEATILIKPKMPHEMFASEVD